MPMELRKRARPVEPPPVEKKRGGGRKKKAEAKEKEAKKDAKKEEVKKTEVEKKVEEKPEEKVDEKKEETKKEEEKKEEEKKEEEKKEEKKEEEEEEKKEEKPEEANGKEPEPPKPAEEKKSSGKLEVGGPFPDVTLQDQDEKDVDLNKVAEESGFVLFVYPKANTPGCTKQACGFRDSHEQIVKAGYKVFGISPDKPKSQMTFKTKQSLPYSLLADPTMKTLQRLGVAKMPKSAIRSHIVVAKGGLVEDINIQISPLDSVSKALAFTTKK